MGAARVSESTGTRLVRWAGLPLAGALAGVAAEAAGELVRRPSELDVTALAAAFTRYGYPWRDGDPHAGEYRRWVPGIEDLPTGANALLAARAKDSDDADELRAELVRLGVIVKDEKKKQYWRLVR